MKLNGRLAAGDLTLTSTGHRLRADAAASYERLSAAFRSALGVGLAVTDAYRDLAAQIRVKAAKGALAAVPGTSQHGWAVALDLASGVPDERSAAHRWMDAHASEYGWINPSWAQDYNPNNGAHEPWHWEYVPALDQHAGGTLAARPTAPPTAPPTTQENPMLVLADTSTGLVAAVFPSGAWALIQDQASARSLRAASGVSEAAVDTVTWNRMCPAKNRLHAL